MNSDFKSLKGNLLSVIVGWFYFGVLRISFLYSNFPIVNFFCSPDIYIFSGVKYSLFAPRARNSFIGICSTPTRGEQFIQQVISEPIKFFDSWLPPTHQVRQYNSHWPHQSLIHFYHSKTDYVFRFPGWRKWAFWFYGLKHHIFQVRQNLVLQANNIFVLMNWKDSGIPVPT